MESDVIELESLVSVEEEEIFAFLKLLKADERLSPGLTATDNTQLKGVFLETILHLEVLEKNLTAIFNRVAPTREDYTQAVEQKDEARIFGIIHFFQQLRIDFGLLGYAEDYGFSYRVSSFLSFLDTQSDAAKNANHPFRLISPAWSSEFFPSDKVFNTIEKYPQFLKTFKRDPEKEKNDTLEIYEDALHCFNQIAQMRGVSKVYTLYTSTEFSLADHDTQWTKALAEQHLFPVFARIARYLSDKPALLAHYVKFDFGTHHTVVLDIILVYENSSRQNPAALFRAFEAVINHATSSSNITGQVRSLNQAIKKRFPGKSAIGVISLSNKASHDFKYWLLNSFHHREQILYPIFIDILSGNKLDPYESGSKFYGAMKKVRHEQKEESAKLPSVSLPKKIKAPKREYFSYQEVLEGIRKKSIWHSNELPVRAREELQLLNLLHAESRESKKWTPSQTDTIRKIELVMQMARNYPTSRTLSLGRINEVIAKPLAKLTLLEKQFLDAISQTENLDDAFLERHKNLLGWQVNSFIHFVKMEPSIGPTSIRDIVVAQILDKDDFNETAYRSIVRNLEHINELAGNAACMAQHIQARSNAIKNKKLATDYLQYRLQKDVSVCRLQLWHDSETDVSAFENNPVSLDKLEAFKILLTDFMKNLQRFPGQAGGHCIGYIGSYVALAKPRVDIVFIYENSTDPSTSPVQTEPMAKIAHYWSQYISIKEKSIQTRQERQLNKKTRAEVIHNLDAPLMDHAIANDKKSAAADKGFQSHHLEYFKRGQLRSRSIPIMRSVAELAFEKIDIPSTSTELKSKFIKHVVDYFRAYPLLLCDSEQYQKMGGKLFIKGSMDYAPRKKESSGDNSP